MSFPRLNTTRATRAIVTGFLCCVLAFVLPGTASADETTSHAIQTHDLMQYELAVKLAASCHGPCYSQRETVELLVKRGIRTVSRISNGGLIHLTGHTGVGVCPMGVVFKTVPLHAVRAKVTLGPKGANLRLRF